MTLRKHGGLWFLKCGSIRISFCLIRDRRTYPVMAIVRVLTAWLFMFIALYGWGTLLMVIHGVE